MIRDNYIVYLDLNFKQEKRFCEFFFFRRIGAVIVCLWSSNFGKRNRQFICYILHTQDSHNPHSHHYPSLFRYPHNHLLINLVTPQVFAHLSWTANKILMRKCQSNSKLILYLQPELYKDKLGTNGSHTKCFKELKF